MTTEDFVALTPDNGIMKKILVQGTGEQPRPNTTVRAHYVGTLQDGSVFDSSRKRGKEFTFPIGVGELNLVYDDVYDVYVYVYVYYYMY